MLGNRWLKKSHPGKMNLCQISLAKDDGIAELFRDFCKMEDGVFFFKGIRQWTGDLFSVSLGNHWLKKPFSDEMNLR